MQFFIDSKGTTVNLISDPVYEGSTNANELVLVAPISSANQVTATFMLPIGISTTERLLTLQNSMSIDGVNYNVWRCLLDGTITEYAGTVRVQFKIYQGSGQNIPIILNTYTSSFVVSRGITPQLPNTPSENIYANILQYLSSLNPNFNIQSVVYSAPDVYKISTGSNTNTVAKIPENLVIKSSGVDFSAGNIGAEDKTEIFPAFFACGENKSNTNVGFQINFNTATEIGRMSIYLFREYYPTALDIYAITSDGKETLVDSFISCAPSDDVICVSVNVGLDNVTAIRVIQPYEKNAEMDAKDDTIPDKGFQNGRFYVQKILFWKQNSEGYFSLISSTGRTLVVPDASYDLYVKQSQEAVSQAQLAQKGAEQAQGGAESAKQGAEDALAELNNKAGKVGGYPVLADIDGSAKIPSVYIQQVDIKDYIQITDESQLDTIPAQKGDVAVLVSDINGEKTITKSWLLLSVSDTGVRDWAVYGTSYATNAGNATYAQSSENALKVNGLTINGILSEADYNALVDKTGVYFVAIGE